MKHFLAIILDAIEILQWGRFLADRAFWGKPSHTLRLTQKVIASIRIEPMTATPEALDGPQLNLSQGISTSLGTV